MAKKGGPTTTTNQTSSQNSNSNTSGNTNLDTSSINATNNQNTSSTSIPVWQQQQWNTLLGQLGTASGKALANPISASPGVGNAANISNGFITNNVPGITSGFERGTQNIQNQQVDADALSAGIKSGDPFSAYSSDPNSGWNSEMASKYMNPYTDQVINANDRLSQRQLSQSLAGADAGFASSGALGGDRNAVERANLTALTNQNQSAQDAALLNSGYQNSQAQYNADQARKLQAASGTATVNQQALEDLLAGKSNNTYANFAAGQNAANEVGTLNSALSGASGLGTQNLSNQITANSYPTSLIAQQAGILGLLPNQSTTTNSGMSVNGSQGNTNGVTNSVTNASSNGNGQQTSIQSGGNSWMQGLGSILGGAAMFLNEGGIVDSKTVSNKKKYKKGKK